MVKAERHGGESKERISVEGEVVAKSRLCTGKLITVINVRDIGVVSYSTRILGWSQHRLYKMVVKTRKWLAIFQAPHKKDSVARVYIKRNVGTGLISVTDYLREEDSGLFVKVRKSED